MMTDEAPKKLIRPSQLKELTGIDPQTLRKLSRKGMGPPVVKIGSKAVAWEVSALNRWIEAQQEQPRA